MFGSALILFREGLEGSLVVGIVLAYLRSLGRRDRFGPVWMGTAAGIGVSLVAGVMVFVVVGELEGDAEFVVEALIGLSAAAVLTWMVFWMRRQARAIKGELQSKVDAALSEGSVRAMVGVVFFAVVREGLEAALFFLAVGGDERQGGALGALAGGALGLALAVGVGYGFYRGARFLDIRRFFAVSGVLILVFAAGLLASAVGALQELGLPSAWSPVFDLGSVKALGDEALLGGILNGLTGWDPAPSIEMIVVWALYLVTVGRFYLRGVRARVDRPAATAPAPG